MFSRTAHVTAICAALTLSGIAPAEDLLWQAFPTSASTYTTSDSVAYDGSFSADQEVADDIEATGLIQRIDVPGRGCGSCAPADVEGVYVRLYEWTDSGPGALQHERFVSAGPDFTWDGLNPYGVFITLDDPIPVNGWHFLSVQIQFGATGGVWSFEQANRFNPVNMPVYFRNNLDGGPWQQDHFFDTPINSDFVISIYGQAGVTQPVVGSLSRTTVTGSDRIIVTGNNFGAPGNGQLLVDGQEAIVTRWSSTEVIGYIPEGVSPGPADLTVVNLGTASAPMQIEITPRSPNGHVRWVFEAAGNYTTFAPGIGPDGTIYFDDIDGNLYAMTGDGGLLWIIDALRGEVGNANEGPVTVADDGTIYVGTNPLGPTAALSAFNPDGSHKWTFTVPNALAWIAGPNVGPDGRIYGALGGSQSSGQSYDVLAVNPDGTVAWTSAADPWLWEDGPHGAEIAFGPSTPGGPIDQLMFTADLFAVDLYGRAYGFALADGAQLFDAEINAAGPGTTLGNCQLASNTSTGAFYGFEFNGIGGAGYGLQAFDSAGERLWRFDPDIASDVTHPATGPDGAIYFGWDLGRISAVEPDGSERWTIFNPVMYEGPMPNPTGDMLLAIGNESFQQPAFIEGRSTVDGSLLWSQTLVDDTGAGVTPFYRPRFTPNGDTAYFAALPQQSSPTSVFRIFAIDTATEQGVTGDLTGDGAVNVFDLLELLSAWGTDGPGADLAEPNDVVNVFDLLVLLANWGS